MQSGNVTIDVQASDSQIYEAHVTFDTPYPQGVIPNVVCSLSDVGPNSQNPYVSAMAFAVTNTGFEAIIKKFAGNSSVYPVVYYWMAMV